MMKHITKLLIGGSIIISFVASVHSGIPDQLGFCDPPCGGGPADLCLACASHCVKSCADPSGGSCIPECNENACQCADDYLRSPDGKCVLQSQCPIIEPPPSIPYPGEGPVEPTYPACTGGVYDHRVECGTSCPLTCENQTPGICTADCKLNVCQCDDGYVRARNGLCVRPESCPLKCKPKWN